MKALRDCGLMANTNVFHVRAEKAIEAIKNGSIDIAFVASVVRPLKDKKRCIEIKAEDIAIVGLKASFPHLEKVKRLEQLKDEPWVIGDKVNSDWPNCLSHLKNGFYVEDHFSARFLVLDGHGIAPFQLDYFSKEELSKLAIARIRMPSTGLKLYALLRKGLRADMSLKATALIDDVIVDVDIRGVKRR